MKDDLSQKNMLFSNVTNIILPFYQKKPKGNLLSKKYT